MKSETGPRNRAAGVLPADEGASATEPQSAKGEPGAAADEGQTEVVRLQPREDIPPRLPRLPRPPRPPEWEIDAAVRKFRLATTDPSERIELLDEERLTPSAASASSHGSSSSGGSAANGQPTVSAAGEGALFNRLAELLHCCEALREPTQVTILGDGGMPTATLLADHGRIGFAVRVDGHLFLDAEFRARRPMLAGYLSWAESVVPDALLSVAAPALYKSEEALAAMCELSARALLLVLSGLSGPLCCTYAPALFLDPEQPFWSCAEVLLAIGRRVTGFRVDAPASRLFSSLSQRCKDGWLLAWSESLGEQLWPVSTVAPGSASTMALHAVLDLGETIRRATAGLARRAAGSEPQVFMETCEDHVLLCIFARRCLGWLLIPSAQAATLLMECQRFLGTPS